MQKAIFIVGKAPQTASLRRTLRRTARELGLVALPEEEFISAGYDRSYKDVKRADIVLADISAPDPDTMFELGLAYGMRKPVVLMLNKSSRLPQNSFFHNQIFLPYDDENSPSFREYLRFAIQRAMSERSWRYE